MVLDDLVCGTRHVVTTNLKAILYLAVQDRFTKNLLFAFQIDLNWWI